MKKSILLFAIIASVFVACNPQKDVDYVNQDVYGIWAIATNHPYTSPTIIDTLIYQISAENSKFISEDSLIIYHGKDEYTDNSDIGYIKYKYEVVKDEKLILTFYNRLHKTYTTSEFLWRPDLSLIVDSMNAKSSSKLEIKGLLGKYEWISTETAGNKNKYITDTLENSIIEFKINDFILLSGTSIPNIQKGDEKGIYFRHTMPSYSAIISKKNAGVIDDKVLTPISKEYNNKTNEAYYTITFWFPKYIDNEYSGLMSAFGGSFYAYSLNNNELILNDEFSDIVITFRKIE